MDKYRSLAALKAALVENVDYRVLALDRRSWLTVASPHGGFIEPGSSAIAAAAAGRQYNFFDFQALKPEGAKELHVTSTRFREPQLTGLLRRSRAAMSIHCMGTCHEQVIWLGGLNATLKQLVLEELLQAGISVNPDSPQYRGEKPTNFVNMVAEQGVQLEFSEELLLALFESAPFVGRRRPRLSDLGFVVVTALRSALVRYKRLTAEKK